LGVGRPGASGVVLAIAVLTGLSARAEEPRGYVQFKGGPGIRIEIEGRALGTTEGKDGLIARGVRPGARRFTAHRDGFVPQFGVVMVEHDVVTVQELDAWQPVIEANVESDKGAGALIVDTLPVDTTILARRLGWKEKVHKGQAPFIAREIPAGNHKFTFCTEDKCIDYWVSIPAAGVQKLLIDFEPGHIYDLSKEFLSEWKSASARCERERDRSACKLACENDVALKPMSPSPACNAINGGETTGMVAQSGDGMVKAASTFTPPRTSSCDIDEGSGLLSVSSRQEVEVLLGEESIGHTPIVRQSIPSGCHQLIAVTRDGRRHRVSIRVQPNEERRIKLTF
jgi:hypothetical protein